MSVLIFRGLTEFCSETEEWASSRKRVGIKPLGTGPRPRRYRHYRADGETVIGVITSGGFGPSVDHPVAMGYVRSESCFIQAHRWT